MAPCRDGINGYWWNSSFLWPSTFGCVERTPRANWILGSPGRTIKGDCRRSATRCTSASARRGSRLLRAHENSGDPAKSERHCLCFRPPSLQASSLLRDYPTSVEYRPGPRIQESPRRLCQPGTGSRDQRQLIWPVHILFFASLLACSDRRGCPPAWRARGTWPPYGSSSRRAPSRSGRLSSAT